MNLLYNNNNTIPPHSDIIYDCLLNNRLADLEMLTQKFEDSKELHTLYNIAIFHYKIDDFDKTIKFVDLILMGLKKTIGQNQIKTDLYKKIRINDIENESFLHPVTSNIVKYSSDIFYDDVLLIGASAARQINNSLKVQKYIAGLSSSEYNNFKQKIIL